MKREEPFLFYEFFAGGGMARAGLGSEWKCVFANDCSRKKARSYHVNWGYERFSIKDVRDLSTKELPSQADLSWASFPCQDLSLAGRRGGLRAERSGTFIPFWRLMQDLADEGRAPRLIVLENVCGALTSRGGKDFAYIASALCESGYRFGAVVIDAVYFVPQSRARLFFIAARSDIEIPKEIIVESPHSLWHPKAVLTAFGKLPRSVLQNWLWLDIQSPAKRERRLIDILEQEPVGVSWHTAEQTEYLLRLMSDRNKKKVELALASGLCIAGGAYRRTRNGKQRAEVRFDDVAGCLRTPSGGSSRQTLIIVENGKVRSRLLSPREAARLMGLDDAYSLPENYNDAYRLVGDGVVVPVVSHLSRHVLLPILRLNVQSRERVA